MLQLYPTKAIYTVYVIVSLSVRKETSIEHRFIMHV